MNHFNTLVFIEEAKTLNEGDFALDSVIVKVKSEYHQQYLDKDITVEFIGWNNVKDIYFYRWYDTSNTGLILAELENPGKQQVIDAMNHFNTLDFVEYSYPNSFGYINN